MKKTALITGASRGIGAGIARLFAKEGYRVVINYYKSGDAAEAVKREIISEGGEADVFCCDVADCSGVEQMVGFAKRRFGAVDVLVNNAGVALFGLVTDTTEEERRRVTDVNLHGVFNTSKAVLPDMVSRKSGVIINISSIFGLSGASCETVYSATKGAVISFSKALSREVGPSGIRVNCIAPGVISTDMNKSLTPADLAELKERTSLNAVGEPCDIAAAALFLAGDGAKYITGQVITVDGGII
ncbi:MAG: SDR family oxidoreductase [Clostridiales bacterium]|jgi:3-oxoacyl-[acyl-carrier protein] reductase|nr:SDR family oxidoreductase [Clostridiales bacterium]